MADQTTDFAVALGRIDVRLESIDDTMGRFSAQCQEQNTRIARMEVRTGAQDSMQMSDAKRNDRVDVILEDIWSKVSSINGTVQGHTTWIAAQKKVCENHLKKTEDLIVTSKETHDYQLQLSSSFKTSKMFALILWALTMALAGVAGAYIGAVARRGA